mgnify:CR=1 FL=1
MAGSGIAINPYEDFLKPSIIADPFRCEKDNYVKILSSRIGIYSLHSFSYRTQNFPRY